MDSYKNIWHDQLLKIYIHDADCHNMWPDDSDGATAPVSSVTNTPTSQQHAIGS